MRNLWLFQVQIARDLLRLFPTKSSLAFIDVHLSERVDVTQGREEED